MTLLNDGMNVQSITVSDAYDPANHNVDEVKQEVESGRVSASDALSAEEAGKNRVTLVEWLTEQTEPAGAGAGDTTSEEN